jgi:hypothetical protein
LEYGPDDVPARVFYDLRVRAVETELWEACGASRNDLGLGYLELRSGKLCFVADAHSAGYGLFDGQSERVRRGRGPYVPRLGVTFVRESGESGHDKKNAVKRHVA